MSRQIEIQGNLNTFISELDYCFYNSIDKGILYKNYLIEKIIFINPDGVSENVILGKHTDYYKYKSNRIKR